MSTEGFVSSTAEVDRDRLILEHLALLQHIVGRMSFDIPGRVQRDDVVGIVDCVGKAAPVAPEHAGSVRFVDDQHRIVRRRDLRQID